jgi:multidrug efflux pump subunit AcrB
MWSTTPVNRASCAPRATNPSSRPSCWLVILIFLTLAAQFNSFRDPFVILAGSVPLAMFGALVFTFLKMPDPSVPFWTAGWTTTLNIYSPRWGLVTLVGLVSKNGILIVEFANKLQDARPRSKRRPCKRRSPACVPS